MQSIFGLYEQQDPKMNTIDKQYDQRDHSMEWSRSIWSQDWMIQINIINSIEGSTWSHNKYDQWAAGSHDHVKNMIKMFTWSNNQHHPMITWSIWSHKPHDQQYPMINTCCPDSASNEKKKLGVRRISSILLRLVFWRQNIVRWLEPSRKSFKISTGVRSVGVVIKRAKIF